MANNYRGVINNYFKEHSFVESNIKSYNNFMEKGMQRIVNETTEIIPTIIPQEVENFKIKMGKILSEKPQITEADGSKRDVYPMEARLRNLTYASPIFLEVSALIDDIQRESFTTEIGRIPVMLKSKYCHLANLKREELIEVGEDPEDFGGYFIINGNERVLIIVEDLAANRLFVTRNSTGPSKFTGKLFSERGSFRIPHTIEQMKDGIIYLSFTRFKRVPIISVIKALGLNRDKEITDFITSDAKQYDDIFINLVDSVELKNQEDALEFLTKKIGIPNQVEEKYEKIYEQLDKYLLPHLGITQKERIIKAYNLCKMIRKFLIVSKEGVVIDKDHYMNKRLKLSGDLLGELFRVNLRALIQDMIFNFQRLVKRGKFQSIKIIIREKLLTSRIKSAMATGVWVGGRKGVSQNIDRTNNMATISNLQRVVSLLTSSQENFEARALHSTHFGRLCPIETPEGTPIGLRKNLSILCSITQEEYNEEKLKKMLEGYGLKGIA